MTATIARAAIYPTRVTHLHRSPVHHYGEHGSYSWYVDIDDLPRLPWWVRPFARFEAADHLDGAAHDTLRQRVDAFLARNGVHLTGGRVTALLMPRVLGHTFALACSGAMTRLAHCALWSRRFRTSTAGARPICCRRATAIRSR